MRSLPSQLLSLFLTALLAATAVAQGSGINWRRDLASAQAEAQQTGKPILIHFWTPTCGPCKRLDRTVFNQASVAQALESQFVPVKINAEATPAVARQYAVFQWPTDVITTPQGHAIGKMISPPTPGAYVSQISQVASRFKTRLGAGFDQAVANASQPSQLNSAYAGLSLNSTPAPATQPQVTPTQATPVATNNAALIANPHFAGPPPVAGSGALQNTQPVARYQANIQGQPNSQARYAMAPAAQVAAPSTEPSTATPVAPPTAPAVPPARIANPYYAAASTPAVQQVASQTSLPQAAPPQAAPQAIAPAATTPIAPASVASSGPSAVAPKGTPATPTLGFDGFCPVSMKKDWRWVKGDPRWGIVHRGRTYLFDSEASRDEFWKKPDFYSPALSGNDPVLAIDRGQSHNGTREHSLEYGGQFYMFATEASLQQFSANPARYVAGVRHAMGLDASSTLRR